MLDAGPLDARGELRADLLSQQRRDLPAEEAGDLLRFDAQHRLPDELFMERAEGGGGVLGIRVACRRGRRALVQGGAHLVAQEVG